MNIEGKVLFWPLAGIAAFVVLALLRLGWPL
jgi:hypothetical protein